MKNKLLITAAIVLFIFGSRDAWCQSKPKQHVFYDTVKTVKERVDFSPDTIPVYFKQLEYPEITIEIKDKFLYADRKTKVTNKVIFSIKR